MSEGSDGVKPRTCPRDGCDALVRIKRGTEIPGEVDVKFCDRGHILDYIYHEYPEMGVGDGAA